jgi:hypothetical protein
MKRALIAGVWLFSMACTEAEDEEVGRVPLTLGVADGTAGVRSSAAGALSPAFGPGLTIDVGMPVHWIEVERCAPESTCEPIPDHGYCYFDVALLEWETAMGENVEGQFDDVLRGEPAIVGPIVYGQLPENAGWQSDAAELVEGERYAINAYVYEACDDGNVACVHTKAVGCQFFTIENGELVDITGEAADE